MRKYPIRASDIITPEDEAAGRIYVKKLCKDYLHDVNDAFFAGFELGFCKNVEEFRTISVAERCILLAMATKMMDDLFPDEPGKSSMDGESSGKETMA